VCEQCSVEAIECVYEFLPGQTRSATLRLKNERLQNNLNTMMELSGSCLVSVYPGSYLDLIL
jgi:hypothetical protein